MKVFVLESRWDLGEGINSDVMGVFESKEKAQLHMRSAFEYDIEITYFSQFFKDGKLLPNNNAIRLYMKEMHIYLCRGYSYEFIEYRINEYEVQ
jgi:hypothetical protein